MEVVKIKNLSVAEGGQVFFTVIFHDKWEKPENWEVSYCTNQVGEGLFFDEDFWYTKQIAGTCQFELHQKTASGMRKAIKRYFEKD